MLKDQNQLPKRKEKNDGIEIISDLESVKNVGLDIERYQNSMMQNENTIQTMSNNTDQVEYVDSLIASNNQMESILNAADKEIINRLAAIKKASPIKNLSKNPHSKDLYNAYAKEAMTHTGNIWRYNRTDHKVVELMANGGIEQQKIKEAIKNSLAFEGLSIMEKMVKANFFVKDVLTSNPELLKQIREKSRIKDKGIERSYSPIEN
jgi:hypothetical protein